MHGTKGAVNCVNALGPIIMLLECVWGGGGGGGEHRHGMIIIWFERINYMAMVGVQFNLIIIRIHINFSQRTHLSALPLPHYSSPITTNRVL